MSGIIIVGERKSPEAAGDLGYIPGSSLEMIEFAAAEAFADQEVTPFLAALHSEGTKRSLYQNRRHPIPVPVSAQTRQQLFQNNREVEAEAMTVLLGKLRDNPVIKAYEQSRGMRIDLERSQNGAYFFNVTVTQ